MSNCIKSFDMIGGALGGPIPSHVSTGARHTRVYNDLLNVSVDAASLSRNTITAAGSSQLAVIGLGLFGGILGVLSGILFAKSGEAEIVQNIHSKDWEGVGLGFSKAALGVANIGVSASITMGKVAAVASNTALAGAAASTAPLPIVSSVLMIFYGLAHLIPLLAFRGALQDTQDEKKFVEEIRKELPEKLVRKIGDESLVEKLKGGKDVSFEEIERANSKSIVKKALVVLIGLIALSGAIASVILSGGMVVPLLFAVCAGMWFLMDVTGGSDFIADRILKAYESLSEFFSEKDEWELLKNQFFVFWKELAKYDPSLWV